MTRRLGRRQVPHSSQIRELVHQRVSESLQQLLRFALALPRTEINRSAVDHTDSARRVKRLGHAFALRGVLDVRGDDGNSGLQRQKRDAGIRSLQIVTDFEPPLYCKVTVFEAPLFTPMTVAFVIIEPPCRPATVPFVIAACAFPDGKSQG